VAIKDRRGRTAQERRDTWDALEFSGHNMFHKELEMAIPDFRIKSDQWYNPNAIIAATRQLYGLNYLPEGLVKDCLIPIRQLDTRIYRWITSDRSPGLQRVIKLIGVKRLLGLDSDILEEEVERREIIRQQQIAKQEAKILRFKEMSIDIPDNEDGENSENYVHAISEISEEFGDGSYFRWLTNFNAAPFKGWRSQYFWQIKEKFDVLNADANIGDMFTSLVETDRTPYILDVVERMIYLKSGGKIDEIGCPFIQKSSFASMFDVVDARDKDNQSDDSSVIDLWGNIEE
jgi:hypothetical protein